MANNNGLVWSKKSPTGPTFHGPRKNPEDLIALASNLLRGPLGFGPIQFLMDTSGKTYVMASQPTPPQTYPPQK